MARIVQKNLKYIYVPEFCEFEKFLLFFSQYFSKVADNKSDDERISGCSSARPVKCY
jgi:hypothetical protein